MKENNALEHGRYVQYTDDEQREISGSTLVLHDSADLSEMACLAMSEAQARRLGRGTIVCARPELPDGRRVYYRLDMLPQELCEIEPGWAVTVKVPRRNIGKVMDILYPEGLPERYWRIISAIEGDVICIKGYGD